MNAALNVMAGKRMEIPDEDECPEVLGELMQMCWRASPDERPDFDVILDILEKNAPDTV